jgi:hypothetical protein
MMLASEFETAIVGDGVLPGRRFAVYRNNIAASLIGALAARYPVAARLTGREFFNAMAGDFARRNRPRSPVFAEYGEGFADFIESHARAASVPYLADVARLEAAWWRAYHARDTAPLAAEAFVPARPEDLIGWRFDFLPSVSIVRSRWPIVAIWTAHLGDGDLRHVDLERGETALVARPGLDVRIAAMPLIDAFFLTLLIEGATLGQALAQTQVAYRQFDPTAALKTLVAARLVAAIR